MAGATKISPTTRVTENQMSSDVSTDVRANRVRWLRMLWSGGLTQGHNRLATYRDDFDYEFCCLGVGKMAVLNVQPHEVGGGPFMTREEADLLGIVDPDQQTFAGWNDDDGMTFREIAVQLAERFGIAAEEYQAADETAETAAVEPCKVPRELVPV